MVVAPRDFTSEGGVLEQAQRGIRVSSYEDVKQLSMYMLVTILLIWQMIFLLHQQQDLEVSFGLWRTRFKCNV